MGRNFCHSTYKQDPKICQMFCISAMLIGQKRDGRDLTRVMVVEKERKGKF